MREPEWRIVPEGRGVRLERFGRGRRDGVDITYFKPVRSFGNKQIAITNMRAIIAEERAKIEAEASAELFDAAGELIECVPEAAGER